MTASRHLTAAEAARALNISLATLYAYVSRGLVRSEAGGDDPRQRRYHAEDIERLRQRQQQRRHPEQTVSQALHWGAPLLDSALTLITEGQLYYRGHNAVTLAQQATFEAVASLLWTGRLDPAGIFPSSPPPLSKWVRALLPQLSALPPMDRLQILLPATAPDDLAAYDLRPEAVAHTGARLLHLLAVAATGARSRHAGLAAALAEAWAPSQPHAPALFQAALILCADHELNVSSFSARCVASAAATPYAVVGAGLGALTGARHGGTTGRLEALFDEARTPAGVKPALARWLRRGEALPGFGHRLYPDGDPRGAALLELVTTALPRRPGTRLARALAEAAQALTGAAPTVDFGLVALARALDLPPGAPLAVFAVGRAAGWIGHALEQYATGQLIRPRARYMGLLPDREL